LSENSSAVPAVGKVSGKVSGKGVNANGGKTPASGWTVAAPNRFRAGGTPHIARADF
jgi:hypothetical protein